MLLIGKACQKARPEFKLIKLNTISAINLRALITTNGLLHFRKFFVLQG